MYANLRDTRLYFDVHGPGLTFREGRGCDKPVLFLLHGGPGADHRGFKPGMDFLADLVQLVYVDHRGNGRSSRADPETWDLDHHIDDLEGLRQHLGLERISVLGHSYGGMVAQGYALRYPQAVANLVLSATAPSFRHRQAAQQFLATHAGAAERELCEFLWNGAFRDEAHLKEFFRVLGPWYARSFNAEKFERTWTAGVWNVEQINRAFAGCLRTFDYLPDLPRISCPTLVLGGVHDWICPIEQSELIAQLIPRAQLKTLPNAAHSLGADEPEAYQAILRGFFTCATV